MHHIPHNKECVIIEWHIGNDREGEWKTLRRTVHDDDVQIYYTVLIEDGRREYPVSEGNLKIFLVCALSLTNFFYVMIIKSNIL